MTKRQIFATTAALLVSVSFTIGAGLSSSVWAHKNHGTYSAGEPGDPKKPSRTIEITMQEGEGKMMFKPEKIVVRKGEQIRFKLTNVGFLPHEFLLATREENLKHAEEMKRFPDMEHDDPNGTRLDPNKSGEIIWRFTKVGEFEYGCLIPGHRESGMIGKIIVK
jgi:uncharacterized cupredoxin-like copper-binding protein